LIRTIRAFQISLLLFTLSAPFALPGAQVQNLHTVNPKPFRSYGPYAGSFLAGGRGLEKPINSSDPLLEANAAWTLSLWFKADHLQTMTTLLAGFGEPADEDSRYLGLKAGVPVLRFGHDSELVAKTVIEANRWHFLAAIFDGVTARIYVDGKEEASIQPDMGPVDDAELMIAPDFISDQEEQFRWDQAHLPSTIPALLSMWNHFGGKIADFWLDPNVKSSEELAQMAANPPAFDTLIYEDGSKPWPFQVRQQVGYVAPQPPEGFPYDHASTGKPVAKPLPAAASTLQKIADNEWVIAHNWKLQAAPDVSSSGERISKSDIDTSKWLNATVPGTVLTTYVDRGVYPDPYWDMNNLAIPESLNKQDYWYRVEFPTPIKRDEASRYTLTLNGINYAAQVWLNGNKLGEMTGAFLRGSYDISELLSASGNNTLAVRISPPPHSGIPQEQSIHGGPGENGGTMLLDGPTFVASEGWDWIPAIRDRNSGLWQDVTLKRTSTLQLKDPQIITTLPLPRIDSADVTILVPIHNTGKTPQHAVLHASFEGGVEVSKEIDAQPGLFMVSLTPQEFTQLHIDHPNLWWPNGYGKPSLYHLKLTVAEGSRISDESTTQFGIREVTYEESLFAPDGALRRVEINPTTAHVLHQTVLNVTHSGMRQTPDGWAASLTTEGETSPAVVPVANEPGMTDLVIKVNGVRIAARGGNWGMDDAMKHISIDHLEPYFRLHQLANVNIIRNWVGQNAEPAFYDLADKYGLMVWNDFWESTQDYNAEAQDPELWLANAEDTIKRYRNHPSIVMWCGRNEGVPQPAINAGLTALLAKYDGTRYYTPSSNAVNLRPSGPYHYEDPKLYFDTLNRGFSVELGVPSLSTLESLQHWIAPQNQWPVSDAWAYHDWHYAGGGDIHPFMQHLEKEFGAPVSLPDMERKAQMLNYMLHRAIFEGFNAHLWQPNSGRMIWMTQPAWPSNMWQMFSSDYDTQASYYGVKKACEPQHVQLDLSTYDVAVINTTTEPIDGAIVEAYVWSLDHKLLFSKTMPVSLVADTMSTLFTLPLHDIFAAAALDAPVFVRLKLATHAGQLLSDNFYWLAAHESDLRRLNSLPQAHIESNVTSSQNGANNVLTITLMNPGPVPAIALKLTLEERDSGERILPAYYSDNYVSLLPGESEKVIIEYPESIRHNPVKIGLRGYNLVQTTLNSLQKIH
jgi:hypothetical protein